MLVLKNKWRQTTGKNPEQPADPIDQPRLVVAHFMLGNTYPFTESDWEETFNLAEQTGLHGFALNLGPEPWQLSQAHSAFKVLSQTHLDTFGLFLSLDMNVLPSSTTVEADELLDKVAGMIDLPGYMRFHDRPLLSTFGGHAAAFGGQGWEGWLRRLNRWTDRPVFFMPAFFIPPDDFIRLEYVDGCFAWNNAWPMGNHTTNLREDEPFLKSGKPYMASVSPLFSTHYGATGEWAFNKNWIYRSDNLLFPTRFNQLLSLPPAQTPSIIQVISWNDHGETHAIAPVLGAEPGSQSWTNGMSHEAFRETTRYFIQKWRGASNGIDQVRVWGWWRCHPAKAIAEADQIGRPKNADWAEDLLNFMILLPEKTGAVDLVVQNGSNTHTKNLKPGREHTLTLPFVPGDVHFELESQSGKTLVQGRGKSIEAQPARYNFNMWSGSWSTSLQ